jgi:hypothetical protein
VEVTYKALFELEKMIVLVQKIMAVHQPSDWILATNENKLFAQVVQAHAAASHNLIQIRPKLKAWIRRNLTFRDLKLWLRQEGWDYHFRAITFRLFNLWKKNTSTLSANSIHESVLFILDIPTSSAMDTLIPVIKAIPPEERINLASDPRCFQVLQQHQLGGVPFLPAALNVSQTLRPLATPEEIRQRWLALSRQKDTGASQLIFRGIDLWKIRKSYFQKQFLRKIPVALAQLQLALAVLDTYRVRAIVAATDNHYMGQLFVRAAQKRGLYSLAIQHGMVNHPAGYLPVRASQLSVMGEAVREWLIEKGAMPHQVVVTGQPRFDGLVTAPEISRENLLKELALKPETPTWLIAPEPQLGLWMRDLLFQTLQLVPEIQAIIRVHPNDNPLDYQSSLNAYPTLQTRVRLSRQYSLKSSLNSCEVVLLGRSTLGLEALIVGKPLIVIYPANTTGWIMPPYLQEYLELAPFLGANSPETLVQAWQALQTQENQAALATLRQTIVSRYACNNDGKNAQRVAQLLKQKYTLV